jgi:predicted phage replisome organizer
MAEKDKKYYWLKLKRDFFKRHDIRIIEAMPNGKEYILFYLKLLCESVDHEGNLRFSEHIPYNEDMLSTITDTNVDIVKSAVKLFTQLGMMEIMDDGTLFMSEVQKMIGSETYWAEQKRKQRTLPADNVQLLSNSSPTCPSKSIEIDIEKEIDTDTDKKKRSAKRFTPPTLDEVTAYCKERKNNVDPQKWMDYYTSNGWKVGKNSMKDWKAAVRTWERNSRSYGKPVNRKAAELDEFYRMAGEFANS